LGHFHVRHRRQGLVQIGHRRQQICDLTYDGACNHEIVKIRSRRIVNVVVPKALAKELADVDMATGSELAATAVLPVVERLNELGSIKTKLEPLANRTPADLLASRDRMAHCIFCGARLLLCPWPVVLL
jgi:hypothetical protein